MMVGPKKNLKQSDYDAIDVSTKDTGNEQNMIDAKRAEFLGGDDDDLKQLGFLDDDDKIDFSNFKVGKNADSEIAGEDE